MRWALSWVMWSVGEAIYWFDVETLPGSYIYRWTRLPLWRLSTALTEGSKRVQGDGPGPWIGPHDPCWLAIYPVRTFRADLDDDIPF